MNSKNHNNIHKIAQFVFDKYLKHEYTDTSNTAAWKYPTAKDIKRDPSLQNKPIVYRPNHGLAHTLRVCNNIEPIVAYLKKFGNNPEQYQFSAKDIYKLQIAALFSVVGRDNDTGWAGDPVAYEKMRKQSGDRFEKFCRANNIFSSEAELQTYKKHLIAMGDPGNKHPIHVVINMAHKLDLVRCFNAKDDHATEAVLDYVNEHSKFKNNKHMLDLVQYSIDTNLATGNRVWSEFARNNFSEIDFDEHGDPKFVESPKEHWNYQYDKFYSCSTNVETCMDEIATVAKPQFVTSTHQSDKPVVEQFANIANLFKQANMATRLVNTSLVNHKDIEYEFDEWVDPVHHRYVRPWWKDAKQTGDRKVYRDQIHGKLIERPVEDYLPLEQQQHIRKNPSLSTYWQQDANGNYIQKPRPIRDAKHMGSPKLTDFTKKRSFSLLRPDGKVIHFKGPAKTRKTFQPFGIGCDVELLHQKGQRYIWRDDTRSSMKFWLGDGALDEHNFNNSKYPGRNHALWLKDLQAELMQQAAEDQPREWYNEMLMGGNVKALQMVFAKENTIDNRLATLYAQTRLHNEYGINLPLMIVDGEDKPGIYTKEQIYADLLNASMNSHLVDDNAKEMFDKIVKSFINHYRWQNEMTKYVDLTEPRVVSKLKLHKNKGVALDDDSRAAEGLEPLSAGFKVAELLKHYRVDELVFSNTHKQYLVRDLFTRLDTVNHKLKVAEYNLTPGLEPATIKYDHECMHSLIPSNLDILGTKKAAKVEDNNCPKEQRKFLAQYLNDLKAKGNKFLNNEQQKPKALNFLFDKFNKPKLKLNKEMDNLVSLFKGVRV